MTTNNKYNLYFFFAIIVLGFSACDEDSFSQVVKIDFPEHTPQISAHARWADELLLPNTNNPNEANEPSLLLTNSLGALEDPEFTILSDATAALKINNELVANLSYNADKGTFVFPSSMNIDQYGATYTLEVSHPDYTTVTAEQVLPKPTTLIKATYEVEGAIGVDSPADAISITIKDDYPDEENFYVVQVYSKEVAHVQGSDTTWYHNLKYLESENPIMSTVGYGNGISFSDATFSGQTATLEMRTTWSDHSTSTNQYYVILKHVSAAEYYYEKSRRAYNDSKDNPFAQPVTIYSNIDNGFGIFTLSSNTQKRATVIQ